MFIRIVKLTFAEDKGSEFQDIFFESAPFIRQFEGCLGVKLLKQTSSSTVYFTYSYWESEEHLNLYRKSEFFQKTWARTKILFAEKAEAWTTEEVQC